MRYFRAILFLLLGACPSGAWAQDYPSGTIRVICSFAAGSGADVIVRFYANQLAGKTGGSVIVENRTGAQGNIGAQAAAKAKPDGRTLYITANTLLAGAPSFFLEPGFDPIRDYAPVATLARLSFVFVVRADSDVKTIPDLLKSLRTKPDDGFYGATTNTGIVAAEMLKARENLKTVRVPYKDVSDALRGVKQNEAEFIVFDAPWVLGQVRNGTLRALALTSAKPAAAFPDVPTVAQLGYADFDLTPWWGVFAPADTPASIVDRLSGWFAEIAQSETSLKFLTNIASDPYVNSPAQMKVILEQDVKAWANFVKLANLPKQ